MRLLLCGERMPTLQSCAMRPPLISTILRSGRSDVTENGIAPMKDQEHKTKTSPAEALELLNEAWAYYAPEPAVVEEQREPALFEYANAA